MKTDNFENLASILRSQSLPKSILDMTPYELSQVDARQNANRGFIDNSDEDLEHFWGEE